MLGNVGVGVGVVASDAIYAANARKYKHSAQSGAERVIFPQPLLHSPCKLQNARKCRSGSGSLGCHLCSKCKEIPAF